MKKLICIILVLTIYAGMSIMALAEEDVPQEWQILGYTEEYWKNHDRASIDCINMFASFGSAEGLLVASDYPDNYGGCYLNDEGNLVIYVLGDIEEARKDYAERTKNENIIVEQCSFSFRRLTEIMNEMYNYKVENPDCEVGHNNPAAWIKDDENLVYVGLKDFSEERMEEFRETFGLYDECIVFIYHIGNFIAMNDGTNAGSDVSNNAPVIDDILPIQDITVGIDNPADTGNPIFWIISAGLVLILAGATIVFIYHPRFTRALQTNNGAVVSEDTPAYTSKKQIVSAVEKSTLTPSDDVFKALMERIDE